MSQPITVNLSDKLYQQLQRIAELSHQSPEIIIEQSLAHSLPPLLEDIPPEYQSDVFPLLQMSEAELQQEIMRVFSEHEWADYELLLDKKKVAPLTPNEQTRLNLLRRKADVLTFRKAYAAVLLKRQGKTIPSLPELEHPN